MGRNARRRVEPLRHPQRQVYPLHDLLGRLSDQQQRHPVALRRARLDALDRDELRSEPARRGTGRFPLVYRKGRAAEQHHPRYPGGRLGQPLAQYQQGAGAAEPCRQPDNQLLQQRGVAEQRIFRRCLLPFARRQDVLRRSGRVQPVRSPRHPRADVCPGRAAQQFPDQADARARIPCRPRDRPVAQRKLFQHPVLCAGIHPQRQLRIRLHPQGVQRRLGGDRHRQHGGVHQRAARGL